MESKQENQNMITLRVLELSDVDDFMVWATDEKVTKFCSFDPYNSQQQALDYITNTIIPHPYYRAICLHNRPIGAISVIPKDHHRGEMGYLLASAYWGRGIVTRAVEMVVSSIFTELPSLERVEALVDVENKGSQRVLEKAGFTREGVLRKYVLQKGRLRDMVMFSVVSSDPQVNYLMRD